MTLTALQAAIAHQLSTDPYLVEHHFVALAEDQGNIESEIDSAIAKLGICAIIVTPAFTATQQDAAALAGTADLRIAIYEIPLTNRSRASHITALAAAEHIMQLSLQWPCTTVTSLRQTPVDDNQGGITVELSLTTHMVHTSAHTPHTTHNHK